MGMSVGGGGSSVKAEPNVTPLVESMRSGVRRSPAPKTDAAA